MWIAGYLQFQARKSYQDSLRKVLAMGRLAALSIFSLLGFTIGFLVYLAHPTVSSWIINSVPNLLISQTFVGSAPSGSGIGHSSNTCNSFGK
jgi:hypothetical protein